MGGKRIKKSKTGLLVKLGLTPIMALVLVAGTLVYYQLVPGETAEAREVLPGVSVEGIDLSKVQRREGLVRLARLENRVRETPVTLEYNGVSHQVTMDALGASLDVDATMDRALALGEELGVLERWYAEVRPVDRSLAPVLQWDGDKTRQTLLELFGALENGPEDARLEIGVDDRVEVVPAREGYAVDWDQLFNRLNSRPVLSGREVVQVPVLVTRPAVTTEEVRGWGVTGLVAEFSTRFNPEQGNRNHNIALAAGKLDGLLVAPGEVFSFNEAVGPRSSEQGYRMANVVVGNKLEEDLGGGVCQVSTTLYNAVLQADLPVEQRSNHNVAVSYVPAGRDAAVAYDYLDFKFRNDSGSHLLLRTFTGDSTLKIKIYGTPRPDRVVQLKSWVINTVEPETVYQVDPEVTPGTQKVVQKGAPGFAAAAERVVLVNGRETKREPLPGSKYRPMDHIIAVHSWAEIPEPDTVEQGDGVEPGDTNPAPGEPDNAGEDGPIDDTLGDVYEKPVPENRPGEAAPLAVHHL